jgi:hypothetical protein
MPTKTIFGVKERSEACFWERASTHFLCVQGAVPCAALRQAPQQRGRCLQLAGVVKRHLAPAREFGGHNTKHITNCQHCFPDGIGYEAPPWEGSASSATGGVVWLDSLSPSTACARCACERKAPAASCWSCSPHCSPHPDMSLAMVNQDQGRPEPCGTTFDGQKFVVVCSDTYETGRVMSNGHL